MGLYENLGVRRIINADARLTRLGGSLMPAPVLEAMREAAASYVDIFELQRHAGRRLAELTHNQAAYVCTGAASGIFLATLACMVGDDLVAASQLPRVPAHRCELIIHEAHRIPYDQAALLAGARFVQIGGAGRASPSELDDAIGEHTAAVLYIAGEHLRRGALPLDETVALAHARGVPVIVDAAAQLPPPENLWRFTRDAGADMAIFSGGKALCGPQASGLIVGRAEYIAACAAHGAPHQRLGRPMKVGKEEIAGLVAAVEWYLAQDHQAWAARFEATVQLWIDALAGCEGVRATRDFPNEAGQPIPRLRVELDPAQCGLTGGELASLLWEGDPPIAAARTAGCGIYLTPDLLQPGEEQVIAARLPQLLADVRGHAAPSDAANA